MLLVEPARQTARVVQEGISTSAGPVKETGTHTAWNISSCYWSRVLSTMG